MAKFARPSTTNEILANLSATDYELLKPHLKSVELPARFRTERRSKAIKRVYFIESGIVSVVAVGLRKRRIEIGLIGREGMTGFSIVMGVNHADHESFVQITGAGQCISAAKLEMAMKRSISLHRALLLYVNSFSAQVAQTAVANGHSKIEERLARWLLMAHDRIEGDELQITHKFLSALLGVRRPGVTEAISRLQAAQLIRARRGAIVILDRKRLIRSADGTYRP